jgi:hypothetical protein
MAASQIQTLSAKKPAVVNPKETLDDLLNRLPIGSTLRPALILYGGDEEASRCWEVKHERLSFWVVRDTPEDAVRAFIHAVDKRGLRPLLEGTITPARPTSSPEQAAVGPRPAVM